MEKAALKRSSRVLSENVKPNLKRKAAALSTNDGSGRPALRNLTNSKNILNKTSEKKGVEKKIPNYLKPTFSTQQKCTQKKVESREPQPPPLNKKKRPQVSTVSSAETRHKPVKEPTSTVSENCFGFEDETENEKLAETSNVKKQKSDEKKSEELDIASPVRIELVPLRKITPSTPKPPVNHVLSVLKSSLSSPLAKTPRTVDTKLPQFFKTLTPQRADESSVDHSHFVDEPDVSFEQPPRRSYTRQRPVTNFTEFDEPSSGEEEEKEKENVTEKEERKSKQKKQKKTKKNTQDKQFEELAAAMNSQFNQVENFQLVVE